MSERPLYASIFGPLAIGLDYHADRWVQASRLDQALPPFVDPVYPPNVGDWFISKATERLLDFSDMVLPTIEAGPETWDYVNEHCDALIVKGGNYLHRGGLLSSAVGLEVFSKVHIPIVVIGAGVQAPAGHAVELGTEDVQILEHIAATGGALSVRGYQSAEALDRLGIDAVHVTGCPTLLWSRQSELHLRPPGRDRAVFSFRQFFYERQRELVELQFRAIDHVRSHFGRVQLALQGEEVALQRLFQTRTWGAEYAGRCTKDDDLQLYRLRREPLDPAQLDAQVRSQLAGMADERQIDWAIEHSFFSWDITDYLDLFREVDLVAGCRLHGNLLAIASGTPAYYLTYDERTREIVEFLDIPNSPLDAMAADLDPVEQDWAAVERGYRRSVQAFREFFARLDMPHRIEADPVPADSSQPVAAGV